MARIEVRPATREDIFAFMGECRQTIKAVAAVEDGEVIAVGGLSFVQGRVVAFCNLTAPARKYPKLLHKMALAVMAGARLSGHRFIFAECDQSEPTAERWLTRLGFKPVDQAGRVMLWVS